MCSCQLHSFCFLFDNVDPFWSVPTQYDTIVSVVGYAHPSGNCNNNILLGRLGGLLAYKSLQSEENNDEISKGKW